MFTKENGRKHSFKHAVAKFDRPTRTYLWNEFHKQLNPRSCDILHDGNWITIPIKTLKKGMVFRIRNKAEGGILKQGSEVSVAKEDAHYITGVWGVKCAPFNFINFARSNMDEEMLEQIDNKRGAFVTWKI